MTLLEQILKLKAIDAQHRKSRQHSHKWKDADLSEDTDTQNSGDMSSQSLLSRLKHRYQRVQRKTNVLERILDKEMTPPMMALPPGHHGQSLVDLHQLTRPQRRRSKPKMEPLFHVQIAERNQGVKSNPTPHVMDNYNMALLQKLKDETRMKNRAHQLGGRPITPYSAPFGAKPMTLKHSSKFHGNPFGGALGDSIQSPVRNPYDSRPILPVQNPMYPNPLALLQQMQSLQTMGVPQRNAMNPLNLQAIPGMRGRYASRRRLGDDVFPLSAISKCVHIGDTPEIIVCLEYNVESHVLSIDALLCADSAGSAECDGISSIDGIQYFDVDRLRFESMDGRQCAYYGDHLICIEMDSNLAIVNVLMMEGGEWIVAETLSLDLDSEYDRSCADFTRLDANSMCLSRDDESNLMLDIKRQVQRSPALTTFKAPSGQ